MNLLFRLIYIVLFSRFRSQVTLTQECVTPFRVWFTDLDVLWHMNNGVFLSLQDLARVDLMIRAGAAKTFSERGWYPVVASEMIRFRKSLKLFQKFEIRTKLIYWDEKYTYVEHRFTSGNEIIALGIIRGRFLKKSGGAVSPAELLSSLGLKVEAPPFPEYLRDWVSAEKAHSEQALKPSSTV